MKWRLYTPLLCSAAADIHGIRHLQDGKKRGIPLDQIVWLIPSLWWHLSSKIHIQNQTYCFDNCCIVLRKALEILVNTKQRIFQCITPIAKRVKAEKLTAFDIATQITMLIIINDLAHTV